MSLYVDIKKTLGKFTLDVKFEAKDEILALLGASGCGKSMTLKCISGIEKPDSGEIVLNGKVLFNSRKKINLTPQQRETGYLFQNYALFPNMTVEENIASGIILPKSLKQKLIDEKIKIFFLEGLEKHYPSQLSGGQQQRVALARILATEPNILMLDEPFSALDSYLKWQLEQEMSNALKSFKGTTLFVSHNRDEVFRICDKIAIISKGKVEEISEKWDLFSHPKTVSASLLTGCKNISKARKLTENTVEATDFGFVLTTKSDISDDIDFVGIRARFIKLVDNLTEINSFEFEVVKEIEDIFTVIFMIKLKKSDSVNLLRWEINKEFRKEINIEKLYLRIIPENILLLKKDK